MPFTTPVAKLDRARVRAVTLDLDDTLWPVGPTIARAERVLQDWLAQRAPRTADLLRQPGVVCQLREAVTREHADRAHDLGVLRRESIRAALRQAGDDPVLAEAAFEVFFAERQRVTPFDDALPALRWLAERYPLVAVSNGNADVHRIGLGPWFRDALSASRVGSGKPHAPIFHAAAAAVGVPPQAVLHVGDDARLDVAGAIGAGMQAAWVVRDGIADLGEPLPAVEAQPHLVVADLHALCAALQSDQ